MQILPEGFSRRQLFAHAMVALLALSPISSRSQELTSLKVSRHEIGIGEQLEIVAELKPIENSNQTVCNLVIDFGDGRTEQVRVTSQRAQVLLKHEYRRPGAAVIQVFGKTRFQGLSTAFGCFGAPRTIAVNVLPENYEAKRAAAAAAKEEALRRAEADLREAEASAARAQAERNAAQAAEERARRDRRSAEEKGAKDRAAREARRRELAARPAAVAPRPAISPPPGTVAPAPASPARRAVEDAPPPKVPATKAKSSLDL